MAIPRIPSIYWNTTSYLGDFVFGFGFLSLLSFLFSFSYLGLISLASSQDHIVNFHFVWVFFQALKYEPNAVLMS